MRPRLIHRAALAIAGAALAAGCGDLYADPVPSFTPTPFASGASFVDAAATIPHDFVTPCPANAVEEGAACKDPGLTCEYGSSPDMRCNTTLACAPNDAFGPTWTARPSVLCPTYACPAKADKVAQIDGTVCEIPVPDASAGVADASAPKSPPPTDADELVCPLSDGVCACTTGPDAAHAHNRRWVCTTPISACPAQRPLSGSECFSPRSCDYGSCAFKRGIRMSCDGSVWTTGESTCN